MNKEKDSNQHPEVKEMHNICDISSPNDKTKDVCDKVKQDPSDDEQADDEEKEHHRKDKALDESLKETFPASDSTAEY